MYIYIYKHIDIAADKLELIHLPQYINQKSAVCVSYIKHLRFVTGREFIYQLNSYRVPEKHSSQ